ncbi:MAG: HlyD family secretion protein [Bacteroidales bacterium]|jgi:HlyD family secretion protein|nr:HlyD family secretion protein [Bacteroidales bacterium]
MEEEKEIKQEIIQKEIELKSPAVQEILGRPPRWIIRWGISIIFIVVAGLIIGSYFFKYPDVIQATITVTTENLPAGVIAKTTGRIDSVFVSEKQFVQKGDMLAVIENPADFSDVLKIKNYELRITNYDEPSRKPAYATPLILEGNLPSEFCFLPFVNLNLGELQPAYQQFTKAQEDYKYFFQTDYHHKKVNVIKKQIYTQNLILQKSKNQLELAKKQLDAAYQIFTIDSNLYEKKVLSNAGYQHARNTYLQYLQSYENAKLGIDHQNMSILQSEQTIFDLEQQRNEQVNQLEIALTGAFEQLQTQLKTWEQKYLFVSPINGIVTFTKFWQKNQNLNAGDLLVTIVPKEQTKIIGKILLLPQGAGKVKVGQAVNVKFDNYPHMEFGMVRVIIKNISLVPVTVGDNKKAYMLEVEFPASLVTNYGKKLTFSQEMTGSAEIITEDLRLLDKFLNPIKAVIRK